MPYTPVFTPENATFSSRWTAEYIGFVWAGDLNLDGKWDLIVPGASYPFGQSGNVGQIGMVLLGDGVGGFSPAPNSFFPNSGLVTVHPRQILVEYLNGDGRPDIFIASHVSILHLSPASKIDCICRSRMALFEMRHPLYRKSWILPIQPLSATSMAMGGRTFSSEISTVSEKSNPISAQ